MQNQNLILFEKCRPKDIKDVITKELVSETGLCFLLFCFCFFVYLFFSFFAGVLFLLGFSVSVLVFLFFAGVFCFFVLGFL
jgi:hypothetical protein